MPAATANRTSVGWARWVRQATIAVATTMIPDHHRDPAVQDVGAGQLGEGREGRPAHQRPVAKDQRRGDAAGRHVRPEHQQRERRRGRERREQREPLARAANREPGRVAGTHQDEDEHPEQEHRRGEVRGDGLPAVAEANGLAAQPRLEPDQGHGPERRDDERATVAVVDEREDREAEDLEADQDGDPAMDPLDPRLRVVERRQELAVTERPVGAAETGVRGTHDDADRDEDQRRDEGRRRELLETGQASSWTARGRHGRRSRWMRRNSSAVARLCR